MSNVRIEVTDRRPKGWPSNKESLTVVTAQVRHGGVWRPVQEEVLTEYSKKAVKAATDRLTARAREGEVAVMYWTRAITPPGYWTFWCASPAEAEQLAASISSSEVSVVPTCGA